MSEMDLRDLDVLVYALSAVLEIGGLVLTIFDITGGQRRLREFLSNQPGIIATVVAPPSHGASVPTQAGGSSPSFDERVDALEAWRRDLPSHLDKREDDLFEHVQKNYGRVFENTYKTLMAQWREVRRYFAGENRSFWRLYLGPALVFIGIVTGFAGNWLNLFAVSSH